MYTYRGWTHLLRLIADLAEAVLHGHAGQQFRATHERQVLGHFVVDALLHVLEGTEGFFGMGQVYLVYSIFGIE